ncbi:MAG TPA: S8 family serine peptidase [Actinomycetota bacterium]|nr:S8 family serine peptidase [Actinomycetota bacterium]
MGVLLRKRLLAMLLCGLVAATLLVVPGAQATERRSRLHLIPFSSGTVDPAADFPARLPAGHDLVLVQFRRFGQAGIVRKIARTGARLIQPLAPVSYIVWADTAQTRAIRGLRGIRWAGVLPPAVRVSDNVTSSTTRLRVTTVARPADGTPVQPATTRLFTQVRGTVFHLDGGLTEAAEIARSPWVYSVGAADYRPELRDELSAQIVATGTSEDGVEPGYARLLERIDADGSGVVVGHVDGGVDAHHPDLAGRIAACIDYALVPGCDAGNSDDAVGHGTHTLGIIMGTGASGLGDVDGFLYGQGIAPGATAVVQNLINATSNMPERFTPVYKDAYEHGAVLSANSWGPSGSPQGYDEVTREFDTMVRDVDASKPGDQSLGLVFSIMNGGGGRSTQGSPDEGKNLIPVGGSGNRGRNAPTPDDLCTCSAHGPALDGRLLPLLVAPGQQVISTRATQGTLCGVPYLGWSPTNPAMETPPSPFHAGCTGTSMASPQVSGAYALFVDWYRARFGKKTPSPALVKAAFVNGAEDLAGGRDADGMVMTNIPNPQQGWGRLHIGNVFDAWDRSRAVHLDQTEVFDRSGQRHVVRVRAVDPGKPLKVTLAWTDAPGPGLGKETPAWVNDLDLVVRSGGTSFLGNAFSKGWSAKGGKPDRKNNVENVYLRRAGNGVFEIVVDAANIIGNGLPNRKGATDQDFALVVANARKV